QLVQAMAGFGGGSGAAHGLNGVALDSDTSQQPLLTTPQHGGRRLISRLTELQVQRAKHGWHCDGGGLYLRVEVRKDNDGTERKSRWWVYRYGAGGNRYHGLGPAHTVGLAEAREQARACRALLLKGVDPIAAGKARRVAATREAANAKTLDECVE